MSEQITTYSPGMKSETDWERVRKMRDEDIIFDEDSPDVSKFDWTGAKIMRGNTFIGLVHAKKPVTLRLDDDVLAWFKSFGPRYQTRINAALRRVMEQAKD